jgi:hypothetical protein
MVIVTLPTRRPGSSGGPYGVHMFAGLVLCIVSGSCTMNPADTAQRLRADAERAVSERVPDLTAKRVSLAVDGNPWGRGLLVYQANQSSDRGIPCWYYHFEWRWSFSSRPNEGRAYAINDSAARLTPSLPLLSNADVRLRRAAGLEGISARELDEAMSYSARNTVPLHRARIELSGSAKERD